MDIIPRHLATRVEEALAASRIVNVVGPRQAGKTTLVRDLLEHERYLTLDDRGVYAAFERDPQGQIELLAEQQSEVACRSSSTKCREFRRSPWPSRRLSTGTRTPVSTS